MKERVAVVDQEEELVAPDQLHDVKVLAQRLSIGYHDVLRLIHDRHLRVSKIPGRRSYRVSERDLRIFMESIRDEDGNGGPKVAPRIAPSIRAKPQKPQQNAASEKRGPDGKFIINRNDYR